MNEPRYLITHSLLYAWKYALKENPFEDATSERDPYAEFLTVLRREPTETTEAMQNGIDFENLVTDIIAGRGDRSNKWYEAAAQIADELRGALLQHRASCTLTVDGISVVLYGRFDAIRAGEITDIKFSKKYERGKYLDSTQHPAYFRIMPSAETFTYAVSNGVDVWHETYRRDETPDIALTIQAFFAWLRDTGNMETYMQHWQAK